MEFFIRRSLLLIVMVVASTSKAAPTATQGPPAAAERGPAKGNAANFADLKARAARGDLRAQITLGVALRDGKGVTSDPAEALAWFRKAAEKNDPAALDHLGWMLEHGLGATADVADAAKRYRAAAEQGFAQGQWNLGRLYAETAWGKYDNIEAAKWYRRAADAGHTEAQYRLGIAYLQDMGVAADNSLALQWFRKSADRGNVSAMLAVGTMYCLGRGVAQSDEEARAWFAKGVRSDDNRAADALVWLDLRKKPAVAGQFTCLKVPHISQGWNMCGVASATMAMAFSGKPDDQYEVKRLCGSPMGEGTDWMDIISAAAKVNRHWELVTFPYDQKGLDEGRARMMTWLDAGHPILLDITVDVHGQSYGHTIVVMGYDAAGQRWIINNPALGPPGIQIYSVAKLENLWHSRCYSSKSPGASRPIILTR
jgi:TPR repeat protein